MKRLGKRASSAGFRARLIGKLFRASSWRAHAAGPLARRCSRIGSRTKLNAIAIGYFHRPAAVGLVVDHPDPASHKSDAGEVKAVRRAVDKLGPAEPW